MRLHLYVLLDRSGSMESMRDAVVAGFGELLAEQKLAAATSGGPQPRITLVQFDTEDPADVVLDGVRLRHAVPLTHDTFVPRGGTPLLDATAMLVARATARAERRRRAGRDPESIVVVTVTDGHENASRHHSLADVMALVAARKAEGWTFAYLGATLDAYEAATSLGYDPRSVQRFAPTPAGARAAFASASRAVAARQEHLACAAPFDPADLFGGRKEAEADGGAHR
jgi:Mg-chelatase subunit ChlD